MNKFAGLCVLCLSTTMCAFSQVDTSYIFNSAMPYGTLDLRLAKSASRHYYLQEDVTFSYRESAPGVKTNTYTRSVSWDSSPYGEGNLREVNGTADNFVMNYRLLKPQNYNHAYEPGYPIIIMFHGAGESANCWVDERCNWATAEYNPVVNDPPAPTDPFHKLLNNDRNLLHGGFQHLAAVKLAGSGLPNDSNLPERAFPGFVLFPQSLNGWNSGSTVEDAIRILRLIIKKYNIDENRVYIHGLSNGGAGVYQALKRAPWLFAAALPMSAITDGGIVNQGGIGEVSKLPLWIFQGGQDNAPTPQKTYNLVRHFRDAGGEVRYYLYPELGHGTWNTAYGEPDFFSWMLEKRKYNPHVYYGSPFICNTNQAGVKMAFSNGFFAYQWEKDGQIIAGETGPEFTADTPGTYRGRFSRVPNPSGGDWQRWSDPIVVGESDPEKPTIEVVGTAHLRGPGLASTQENNTVKLWSRHSAELYNWFKNGEPVDFPGTDIEDTLRLASFTSASAQVNGAYTVVLKNFNCPSPPSDPVNLFFNNSSPRNISIASDAMDLKGAISASTIFLSWNDVSAVETGYEIWRRKAGTPDFKFVTKTAQNGISYQDMGLDPGTTYEYKLRAVNNSGSSNYVPSDDLGINYQFITLGDYQTPPPPQDLTAISNTINSITLRWNAARDENNIREYYVYYNDDSISTGGNDTTYTLAGLDPNTAYAIRVKAMDFGNNISQPSNQIIATTYVTGLMYNHSTGSWKSLDDSAMVASFASPEFTGTVPNFTLRPRTQDDNFNFQFTGYLNIQTEGTYYFNITSDDGSRLIIDGVVIADNDGRHGTRTVASEGIFLTAGPHTIEVQYFDDVAGHNLTVRYGGPGIEDGNTLVPIPDSALNSGTYVRPEPPGPPSGVSALGTGMESIALEWEFADDGQTDYEVYRSTSESGTYEIVARAEGLSVVDSIGLLPETDYYYKVKTVNQNGSSDFSAVASATTKADNVAPSVPEALTLVSNTATSVAFSWQAASDNVGVTHYEIYSGNEMIGTSTMQAFTAEELADDTEYSFTVKAVDASGNKSGASVPLIVSTKNSCTVQPDLSTPKVEITGICAPGPGSITISSSQKDVSYQVLNDDEDAVTALVVGTGGDIELEFLPDKLVAGENKVTVTAGFDGCDRHVFAEEFTVEYVSTLTVDTESDVTVCEGGDVILEASGAPTGGFYKWFDSKGDVIEGDSASTFQVNDVITDTTYYVAVAHRNGCESELARINIHPDTLSAPVVELKGDSLVTQQEGFYQWRKEGEDIPGATFNYYRPSEDGSYTVVVSSGSGCYTESDPYEFELTEVPVTGIENGNNSEFSLNIYPMPSSGQNINVLLRTPKTDPVLIEIIDAMGRLHYSHTIEAGELSHGMNLVPGRPLHNGIYFIRATQAEIRARKKVIVKD